MTSKLLLWDIDGTLLSSDRAGVLAFERALQDWNVEIEISKVRVAGSLDPLIAADALADHPQVPIPELIQSYLKHLPETLSSREGNVYPGVIPLLQWVQEHSHLHNALLTGNVQAGAWLKLKRYQLDKYFSFGAFGDDGPSRNHLGPVALERARNHLKQEFTPESTWIIGDTPHDITCARALGCRVLSVATGRFTLDQLKEHQPDVLLEDLSSVEEVKGILEG